MNSTHVLAPLLVLAFPFLGAVIGLFLERRNPKLQAMVSTVCMGLACGAAWILVVLPAFGKTPETLNAEDRKSVV